MNNIIKLSSGETIIAEIVNEDDYGTTIMDPLAIDIVQHEEGGGSMVALSWIPLKKGREPTFINLNSQHILAIGDIDEEIDSYYRRAVATIKGDAELLSEILVEESLESLDIPTTTYGSANTVH